MQHVIKYMDANGRVYVALVWSNGQRPNWYECFKQIPDFPRMVCKEWLGVV